jgi:hypothetical protein
MATLYELTEQWTYLLSMAEDEDVDPDTLRDTLEGIEGEIEIKADGYARVIAQLEHDAAAIKAEEKRLKNRRVTIEANIDRMKKSLQAAMEATGKTKFKTDLFSFGIQKNAPSVVIDTDINNLPTEFLKFREPEVDKTKLKEALKNGEDLEGFAHLEQTSSLRIR